MSQALTIEPARSDELAQAFRLVFQHLGDDIRQTRVDNALRMIESGQLDRAGILVARQGDQVCGAQVCQTVPGASGLVWPPAVHDGPGCKTIEDQLLRHAIAWLRKRGARLGQALLGANEIRLGAAFERNGFPHITRLWYLRHDLNLSYAFLRDAGYLRYQAYQDGERALFHETLVRTYVGTLDCPEVSGVRTLEQVLEGHRATGVHDPARWWLALTDEEPVGVLLLTVMPEWNAWEVAYVGIVPEARGRGWGRELMHKALREAHTAEVDQLTLSVDARNRPAWQLYAALGFEVYDYREVYLAIWKGLV